MTRCIAITKTNWRCKKTACFGDFCTVHGNGSCIICQKENSIRDRHTLKKCGHIFCTSCLTDQFYKFQWFEGFSTENVIKCPECQVEVADSDWTFITDYLCKTDLLKRKIIFDTYMSAVDYKEIYPFITIGRKYTPSEINKIFIVLNGDLPYWQRKRIYLNRSYADIVCFERGPRCHTSADSFYRFFYGSLSIRNLFKEFQKELIEYVFHPSRIQRFSVTYQLGELGYLDTI
jgi:hypothetical protein